MAEDNAKTPGITSWKAAVVGVASMVTPLAALATPTQQPSVVVQPDKPKPDHGIEWETDKDRQALAKQALDSLKARGAKYTLVTEGISEPLRYKGGDPLKGGGYYRLFKFGEILPLKANGNPGFGKEAWEKVINKIKNEPTPFEKSVDSAYVAAGSPDMDADTTYFGQANAMDDEDEYCGVIDIKERDVPAYLFNHGEMPVVFPKHLGEFLVETHEMTHCAYRADASWDKHVPNTQPLSPEYISSVNETAADLGSSLYFANKTGSFSIFKDLIEPSRLASVGDKGHSTAYALALILKDIDPKQIQSMEVGQIPDLVIKIMGQHFEKDGYLINPHDPSQSDLATPVMNAMNDEIISKGSMATRQQLDVLGSRINDSLSHNHDSFFHLLGFGDKAQLGLDIARYSISHAMAPSGIPMRGGKEVNDIESYDMIDELRLPRNRRVHELSTPGF